MQENEIWNKGSSTQINLFGIISMSVSPNDIRQQTLRQNKCIFWLSIIRAMKNLNHKNRRNLQIQLIFQLNINRLFDGLFTYKFCFRFFPWNWIFCQLFQKICKTTMFELRRKRENFWEKKPNCQKIQVCCQKNPNIRCSKRRTC